MQLLPVFSTCSQVGSPWFSFCCVHMQDKCSLMQVQGSSAEKGASISFERCVGHRGMVKLKSHPAQGIKAPLCTNCSGCKECKQPVPLTTPESIGGSSCTAKVAAKAEALRQLAASNQQQTGSGGAGGGDQVTGAATAASPPSNPVRVECAVCQCKPGDPGVPATLKLCGGCQQVRYCSAECQRKDWKLGDKAICEHLRKCSRPS
jgi:hypothetical protein